MKTFQQKALDTPIDELADGLVKWWRRRNYSNAEMESDFKGFMIGKQLDKLLAIHFKRTTIASDHEREVFKMGIVARVPRIGEYKWQN